MTSSPKADDIVPSQVRGHARRLFDHWITHSLTIEQVQFLADNWEMMAKFLEASIVATSTMCVVCLSATQLFVLEGKDPTQEQMARFFSDCTCGQVIEIFGTNAS